MTETWVLKHTDGYEELTEAQACAMLYTTCIRCGRRCGEGSFQYGADSIHCPYCGRRWMKLTTPSYQVFYTRRLRGGESPKAPLLNRLANWVTRKLT